MHVKSLLAAAVSATLCVPAFADITVAMDQQINVGMPGTLQSPTGNAIYPLSGTGTTLAFGTDGTVGWSRFGMAGNGYYYGYLDPILAGIGAQDLSQPGSTISFDARFFQDPQTNTNPYGDAPIFLRTYTYAADGNTALGYRDYSIVFATQGPWNNPPYPTWSRVTVDVNTVGTITDLAGTGYNAANVNRMRWYGTDWAGRGQDFIDIKNVTFHSGVSVPEPGSMGLLLAGLLPLASRLRRRKA